MREAAAITLPGGVWADGERRRSVELRALTGEDEAFVAAEAAALSRAELTTALLSRCVVRLADAAPGADAVRGLTVGDREALLLQLRRLCFGDRLQCVLDCPSCGEALDLELSIDELLHPVYADAAENVEEMIGGRAVRFRLPTGADQEAAASAHEDEAERVLLARCLDEPEELSEPDVEALSARFAELDPQAELLLKLSCPECSKSSEAVLDAATFLLAELRAEGADVYEDVHTLALHYGWSEAEILALPTARRRLYLDLLAGGAGP